MMLSSTVERLRAHAHAQLTQTLLNCTDVALLDYPNHGNVGDSAIWLGEMAFLDDANIRVRYVCDAASYNPRVLRKAMPHGTILLHGGGNLGDLFPHHQALRETVLREHRDYQVVQLPQTVHFRQEDNLRRFSSISQSHPNFTLMLRDQKSCESMAPHMDSMPVLCPDSAFHLRLQRPLARRRTAEVVVLSRQDAERQGERLATSWLGSLAKDDAVDWLHEPPWMEFSRLNAPRIIKRMTLPYQAGTALASKLAQLAAKHALRRGIQILSNGRIAVTDRLHGHILCLLLGIPHVVVDTGYGKLTQFLETWQTTESTHATLANRSNVQSKLGAMLAALRGGEQAPLDPD